MKPMHLATLAMLSPLLAPLFATLLATPLRAQDQATTFAAACDKATVVVVATVIAVTDPSPDWHRMVFRTDEVLAGNAAPQFTLIEASGACCGRSLFALEMGAQRLFFLNRVGTTLHPFGGARGVLLAAPDVLTHVRALLATTTPAARAALLAASLDHPAPRIALDAASALAVMPGLTLTNLDRSRISEALTLAVQRGSTQAAPLIEVIARASDASMLDTLLPLYLGEVREDCARLLRRGLARAPAALLTGRLPAHLPQPTDHSAELRAAQLLRDVQGPEGEAALSALLARTHSPRVQLCIAEAMLAAGTSPRTLRSVVPLPVLHLAERRSNAIRFRSLDLRHR